MSRKISAAWAGIGVIALVGIGLLSLLVWGFVRLILHFT